jgi:hypothetical protein
MAGSKDHKIIRNKNLGGNLQNNGQPCQQTNGSDAIIDWPKARRGKFVT